MNAGALRHRISIQRQTTDVDELGERLDTWVEVINTWADITDRRGREIIESREATYNEVTTDVRIRVRLPLSPELRVVEQCHGQRVFAIVDVRQLYAPRPETMLECQERLVETAA